MKLYFRDKDEPIAYHLDYHLGWAKGKGLTEIELYEAESEKAWTGMFFCKAVSEISEDGECGKYCPYYKPRNGKFGICKYRSNTFYSIGKKVKFEVK